MACVLALYDYGVYSSTTRSKSLHRLLLTRQSRSKSCEQEVLQVPHLNLPDSEQGRGKQSLRLFKKHQSKGRDPVPVGPLVTDSDPIALVHTRTVLTDDVKEVDQEVPAVLQLEKQVHQEADA